jgi:threonylcarbamoyladenosine tRNA methylthiotransferase MtaB
MPAARIDSVAPALPAGRQRAFIKVQDGCRYQCTFCIVTQARGAERSRPIAEVVEEIQALRASGVREVVLSGVHLGGYGSDRGDDLSVLLRAILDDTDIPRVRLGSLEPWDIPDDFWALFDDARLMPHLHLPLQSGCDRTLRRMARRCKSTAFAELIARAREHVPAINITTDIIVGFPGESDTDWRESMETIARIGFGHVHIFTYSPRAGTRAATLPEQVARETKRLRSEQLHALAQRMKHATLRAHLGQRAQVLVEASPLRDGERKYPFSGYTPNFLRVALDGLQQNDVNRIIEVELATAEHRDDCLIARPVASQPTAGSYRSKSAQIGA